MVSDGNHNSPRACLPSCHTQTTYAHCRMYQYTWKINLLCTHRLYINLPIYVCCAHTHTHTYIHINTHTVWIHTLSVVAGLLGILSLVMKWHRSFQFYLVADAVVWSCESSACSAELVAVAFDLWLTRMSLNHMFSPSWEITRFTIILKILV